MVCPHCQGAEDVFSNQFARSELKDYRENGPRKSTQVLLKIMKSLGVQDLTLLDIGGESARFNMSYSRLDLIRQLMLMLPVHISMPVEKRRNSAVISIKLPISMVILCKLPQK